ncbi:MAG: FHA domain-containing protein [Planctomycetia bacterium]|nr:FHA domain-containing protein [Planctomycetia bacterium]
MKIIIFLILRKYQGIICKMKRRPDIVVQLVHILGPRKGSIQDFSEDLITIGRNPSCHLRFPADITIVSRNHAEIIREGNQFRLNNKSPNFTFLNGKQIEEGQKVYLKNGDVLEFAKGGPKVSFLAEIKETDVDTENAKATPRVIQTVTDNQEEIPVQRSNVPLIIQYGPTLRSFKELPVIIGKNPKCGFVIDQPSIFDQHAQIFFSKNQYWIKDLTGKRSVQINRQPFECQASLKDNDDIALSPQGPVFRFLGNGRFVEIV